MKKFNILLWVIFATVLLSGRITFNLSDGEKLEVSEDGIKIIEKNEEEDNKKEDAHRRKRSNIRQ